MTKETRLVLVEDDPEIRVLLRDFLTRAEFRVDTAANAGDFERLIAMRGEPDLVILDVMLPGEDGRSICRRLRAGSCVPIVMLTARGDDIDRIVGLEMGADDYLPKPFNPRELLARIRAVLRRVEAPALRNRRLQTGPLTIDLDARSVATADGALDLTSAEFDLLGCFATRPQRVLSRELLLEWTRGRSFDPYDRTIDVTMSRLRRKLADAGAPDLIKTVRNAGYMLATPAEEA